MKRVLILLVGIFMLFGCNNSKDEKNSSDNGAVKENIVTIGSSNWAGYFTSDVWQKSGYDSAVRNYVFNSLLETNDKGEIVNSYIVEDMWTKKSDSTKELDDIWTYKLKPNLKFSNGDPLTVKDIKFTFDFLLDNEGLEKTGGSSPMSDYLNKVEINEDERTVSFYLKRVIYTTDDTVIRQNILNSKHIKEGAKRENVSIHQFTKAHSSEPIGAGPYKLDEYVESQYVKLSINENYIGNWRGNKPTNIHKIILKNTPDETQTTQLVSGELDILGGLSLEEDIDAVDSTDHLTRKTYHRHGGGRLVMVCDYGPTQLVEVRKALAFEIDRKKFRDIFLGRNSTASQAPYSKNHQFIYDEDEEIGVYSRFEQSLINYDVFDSDGNWDKLANMKKTHELLDEAAEKTEGAYKYLTKDNGKYLWKGSPLTINLAATSSWIDALNLTLTKNLQEEFGIRINVDGMDFSVLSKHLYGDIPVSERKYHAYAGGNAYSNKYSPKSAGWGIENIKPIGQGISSNTSRYRGNQELLDKIDNSNPNTQEGRLQYESYMRQWVREQNENLAQLPLYANIYTTAYDKRIKNLKVEALYNVTRSIIEAYIEE